MRHSAVYYFCIPFLSGWYGRMFKFTASVPAGTSQEATYLFHETYEVLP